MSTRIHEWNRLVEKCRSQNTGKIRPRPAGEEEEGVPTSPSPSPPPPPRPPRLRHRHTVTGLRPRRPPVVIIRDLTPSPPPRRRAAGVTGAPRAMAGPAVLVQTWETRRNGGGAPRTHAAVPRQPSPAGEAAAVDDADAADADEGAAGTQEVATQTHFVSKVVRKVPVGANEVYMVQVCETPKVATSGGERPKLTPPGYSVPLRNTSGTGEYNLRQ